MLTLTFEVSLSGPGDNQAKTCFYFAFKHYVSQEPLRMKPTGPPPTPVLAWNSPELGGCSSVGGSRPLGWCAWQRPSRHAGSWQVPLAPPTHPPQAHSMVGTATVVRLLLFLAPET